MSNELRNNEAAPSREAAILVLEDERVVRQLMEEVLKGVTPFVVAAGSQAEARVLLAARSFDLLIFDLNQPEGRSSDLASEIRDGRFPLIRRDVPIVVTTTVARSEIEPLLKVFNELLPKPWRNPELQGMARKWLDGSKAK